MQEYPVAFKGARILTGEEEGAYGWITINYLLDSFTKVGEGWNAHSLANAASLIFLKLSQCRRGQGWRLLGMIQGKETHPLACPQ